MTPPKITADMPVPDIITQYPQTEDVFKRYGLNPHYKALAYENLSASAKVNQIALEDLLVELNQSVANLAP